MDKSVSVNFSGPQQHAALCMVSGMNAIEAAKHAGVSPRTVYNWLSNPEYRQYVDGLRSGFIEEALGRLVKSATRACDVMAALLESPDPAIRLKSANSLMDMIMKLRDHSEFERRIAALESDRKPIDIDVAADEPAGDEEIPALPVQVAGRIG